MKKTIFLKNTPLLNQYTTHYAQNLKSHLYLIIRLICNYFLSIHSHFTLPALSMAKHIK